MSSIPVREMIKKAVVDLGGKASNKQIIEWITKNYVNVNQGTIRTQTMACTVNQPSRIHLPECGKPRMFDSRYDFLYKTERGQVELYDPAIHGNWGLIEHQGKTTIAKNGVPILNDDQVSLLTFLQNKMHMNANYQPIVIKTLLEKGTDENFSASLDEIKEQIKLLNFDRSFSMGDAIKAVSNALSEHVTFDGDNVSLNFDLTSSDLQECLKICGQKIVQWHIENITKNEFKLWYIMPGSTRENYPFINEFFQTKSIGLAWNNIGDVTSISEDQITQQFINQYPQVDPKSFIDFTRIKQKDLVVLIKGQKAIVDFCIVVDNYYFQITPPTPYQQRKNVIWLKRGPIDVKDLPNPTLEEFTPTCGIVSERKQEMMDVLLENQNLPPTGNFFIITQNPESKYDDIPGKQYAYDNQKPHYTKFVEGTNFIVQTKIENSYYFVGYGKVGSIEKSVGINEKGKSITKIIAKFSKHTKFEEQKIRTDEINKKMLQLAFPNTGFNSQPPAMLPITLSLYREIIGGDLAEKEPQNDTLDDVELSPFIQALKWKPNLILYGPPGTGKTYHAIKIGEKLTSTNSLSYRNFEKVFTEKLIQPSSVQKMSDNEYGNFVIESITKEAEKNGYVFKVEKENYNFVLEKGENKIHLRFTYSKSTTNDEHNCYCGIDDGVISFLKRAPEYNRYIVTVNHSVKNFVVLPYSIEQKHAKFAGRTNSENWDPTGINAHSYHIKIFEEEVFFDGTMYDCKKFVRNIKQIFGQFVRMVTFHQTFSYEEFIEGIKANPTKDGQSVTYDVEPGIFKEFCNIAQEDSENQYVVIIDEINRGNIAKIFGELITIIENDKRGKSVILAYSKDGFSVPKNVLIVGTMNTADQSLTHLDTALKRRFTMMEHNPDPNVLKNYKVNDEINLTDLLKAINNRLIENNFRDGRIGHSYFMYGEEPLTKINDLQMVFAYDVIPLLRDYFYDDESKLKKIFDDYWFDENKDINKDWQGLNNIKKFRDNIKRSFDV